MTRKEMAALASEASEELEKYIDEQDIIVLADSPLGRLYSALSAHTEALQAD